MWLRPKRTFTTDELRAILQEATDAGVAAREEATKKLLKLAKKRRRRNEGSCGWVWLEIEPKLLKHIHKLNIPNVSTSYKTNTIVEDFNLYLDDVRHSQRMSATLDGMKAAAEVLKKHGTRHASVNEPIVISKDEDFSVMAFQRPTARLIWVRAGELPESVAALFVSTHVASNC